MRDFFDFVFKCISGFIVMLFDSSAEMGEYILFGTIGGFVFLLVFVGIEWLIHKYFFVRKNFLAEHELLISLSCACLTSFIYYAAAYIFSL